MRTVCALPLPFQVVVDDVFFAALNVCRKDNNNDILRNANVLYFFVVSELQVANDSRKALVAFFSVSLCIWCNDQYSDAPTVVLVVTLFAPKYLPGISKSLARVKSTNYGLTPESNNMIRVLGIKR